VAASARAAVDGATPTTPVGRGWTLRFGLIWLGLWAAQLAPVQLLLPLQLADVDPAHKVRDFGLVNGVAGVAALVALPVFGALCDRTRSRWGRRRVWVAGGIAVYVVGLLLTGAAGSWPAVAGAWLVAQLGMYAAMAGSPPPLPTTSRRISAARCPRRSTDPRPSASSSDWAW
jgi:MFS family permease